MRRSTIAAAVIGFFHGATSIVAADSAVSESVRFNRDIRPILADHCFTCHGADARTREADLRLDDRDSAFAPRDSAAILVPGDPDASELIRRVTAADESERMPPADHPPLSPAQIDVLRRWIAAGAEYEPHWAFITPVRPNVPEVRSPEWVRNPIDAFVLAEIEQRGLAPATEADRRTLIRRLSLDLTGLPPMPADVERFVADASPDAYEQLVERLLASPRYGERWTLAWLDVARYADTGGYQGDIARVMWPWRDWVIASLNANQPFDEFTIEQLAGDLLPNPTREQRLATGFNRNHRINDEDGIVHEEFRIEYVVDRLETTATAWLGLTVGCARCHDHKYDPFSQREFYQLAAYYNSVDESGRGHGNAPPVMFVDAAVEADVAALDAEIASAVALGDAGAAQVEELKKKRTERAAGAVTTMVMQDLPALRDSFVLQRGAYDKPGEQVHHGTPASLSPLPGGAATNRLALAEWLVDPQHPLTARVTVNRFWLLLLGRGLVRTQEDFGTRGELPTHPELLDWLATEFQRTGWDVKSLLRLIVTSATYRQSSSVDAATFPLDPANEWFARGPRFRLSAETIRDQALAAAGLLDDRLGGPPVMPYHPPGLWEEMLSTGETWVQSHGPDLYRRSMYTYMRRTIPPPSMVALDMPNREICLARRATTNTPLQALVLMNDPTYIEAARVLATTALHESGNDGERMESIYLRVLARTPRAEESTVLVELLAEYRTRFTAQPESAAAFLKVGDTPADSTLDSTDLAAMTAVAATVLNMDEVVTRE
ncbi:MAG: PSD1 domain-containing protein [Planctomycetaceae bacterium]|nr:PSD1 domain-containing protein [Planctomycetaceae bacterium]